MRFEQVAVERAEGAILGHTLRLGRGRVFKKGRVLGADDLAALRDAGQSQIFAAFLDPGDVGEDQAAARVAHAVAGAGVDVAEPFTGRCNLYARAAGVLVAEAAGIHALNAVHEAVTVATAPVGAVVAPGDMVATIKIIPFAVPASALDACLDVAARAPAVVRVADFRARRVGLVFTQLPGVKDAQLERAAANLRTRVGRIGGTVGGERRCAHRPADVAATITELRAAGCDLVLVLGASAIVDRRDVVPLGVELAGGVVERFGMPVDPGNLLLLARVDDIPVVGVPGCARSLKPSGFDAVLTRLCADLPVTSADLSGMGVGGLLPDVDLRPAPRRPEAPASSRPRPPRRPRVAAVVLAAGRSTRMGADNKLLADVHGAPMLVRAVESILAAALERVVVVTGHEAERVVATLSEHGLGEVGIVHNPDYAQGMATSLVAGVEAVRHDPELDAVLVCLGDMPWIAPEHVSALVDAFAPVEGRAICVPTSAGKRGNPVLFAASFVDELAALRGDVGARALLDAHAEVVCQVPMPDSAVLVDVDTAQALASLRATPPGPPAAPAPPPEPSTTPEDA
ncbi:NTP transferase domain-containing protein [Haliangium sp.]|uniref:NTP transferase domain-containing protein n=1 Tax=Haliangium sp. TaxID=2663208 RepID=UPI003D0AC703